MDVFFAPEAYKSCMANPAEQRKFHPIVMRKTDTDEEACYQLARSVGAGALQHSASPTIIVSSPNNIAATNVIVNPGLYSPNPAQGYTVYDPHTGTYMKAPR